MSEAPVDLWAQLRQHLDSKYNVLDYINLWPLDSNPTLLYQKLKSLYKETYQPNEKIVIAHYDTDYYIHDVGFTLYNLFQILKSLDISPSVIILATNHYGLSNEVKQCYHRYLPDIDYANDHPMVIENSYMSVHAEEHPQAHDIDVENINHNFIFLCGTRRSHRVLFLTVLKDLGILDQGLCSWHFKPGTSNPIETKVQSQSSSTLDTKLHLLTTVPHTRLNESISWDRGLKEVFNKHHHEFDSNYQHPLIDGRANEYRFNLPAIKKAFLYISAETVFSYPYPYLTEKTFKAILQKRPFVIVGAPGSLAQLHKLGFKTFNQFWNEDYDSMTDHSQRIRHLLEIVKHISSMSIDQLKDLCYNMKDVLEYNFQHYVDTYSKTDFEEYLKTI